MLDLHWLCLKCLERRQQRRSWIWKSERIDSKNRKQRRWRCASNQKFNFNANWIMRGFTAVAVMVPNVAAVALVLGLPNCG